MGKEPLIPTYPANTIIPIEIPRIKCDIIGILLVKGYK
jgi:hypothetical protein